MSKVNIPAPNMGGRFKELSPKEKKYLDLPDKESRRVLGIIYAVESEPKEKYYLWDWCISYGWRQSGTMNGYDSIEQLKKDDGYKFNLKDGIPMMIMKATKFEASY